MNGVIFNTLTVLLGSAVGLLLKKNIPRRLSEAVMIAIGLCTLYIGVDGALEGSNTIVLIVSLVCGTAVGTALDIDRRLNRLGLLVGDRLKRGGGESGVAEGFVTGSLLFCIGAMTIVGCINAGLTGDNKLLYTKSIMDLISSCMLAGTLGVGVMCAAVFVLLFQGLLVLCAGLLQGLLTDTALVAEITCAGSVMIIGLGLNILGITKLKVADMLPAIVLVPPIYLAAQYLPV
ncbi:MAG: DUF554 domain-containing protein [Oscillospiraceae bacterium]|nr:DUF554 domain-containing protein [Oscillospiraceae bacterium]